MKADETAGEKGDHTLLTEKQCRVLDLLIEHKTSKEIARALGISPHTVDQRISLARGRLGVSSRNELAARYRAMRDTHGQPLLVISADPEGEQSEAKYDSDVYGSATIDPDMDPIDRQAEQQEDAPIASATLASEKFTFPTTGKVGHRVGPEVFEGSSGGLWRLGAIVATALLLVVIVLVLFAIFDQLNDILA